MISQAAQIDIGACMAAAVLLWAVAAILTGHAMDRHRTRFNEYRQSCADAFDKHCDDVAALFPPAPADELAAKRHARSEPS